jgi:hypothetical protein
MLRGQWIPVQTLDSDTEQRLWTATSRTTSAAYHPRSTIQERIGVQTGTISVRIGCETLREVEVAVVLTATNGNMLPNRMTSPKMSAVFAREKNVDICTTVHGVKT